MGKLAVSFQGGLQYDHYLDLKNQLVIERQVGEDHYSFENNDPFPLRTSRVAYWAGAGLQKNLGKFSIQSDFRYIRNPRYNERNVSMDKWGLFLFLQRE